MDSVVRAPEVRPLARTFNEMVTIPFQDFLAYSLHLNSSERLSFTVKVPAGTLIDIYVTDQGGYNDYTSSTAATFKFYKSSTKEKTADFSSTFTAPSAGDYYLILDNNDLTVDGAQPTGPVSATVGAQTLPPDTLPTLVGIVAAGAVVGGLVAAGLGLRRRRRKMATLAPPVVQMVNAPETFEPLGQGPRAPPMAPGEDVHRRP